METQPEAEARDLKGYSARVSDAIYSIGDLFRDGGAKGVRFPKDLLKALEQKLQDIAMGKDPACVVASRCSLSVIKLAPIATLTS